MSALGQVYASRGWTGITNPRSRDQNTPRSEVSTGAANRYYPAMVKFLSRYPDGGAGVALLLLRFSCALVAYPVLERLPLPASVLGLALIPAAVMALALALGFGTRVVALLLVATALAVVPKLGVDGAFIVIAQAGCSGALALLGPGAYSIDARVFGRQVIRFEPRGPRSKEK